MTASSSEKDIENQILAYLSLLPGCYVWKNQSVGIFDPVKKIYRKSNNRFHINGVSDILGIYKGRMLCLEVKSKTGRLSEAQTLFLERMKSLGAITACVRSVDDALHALRAATAGTDHTPAPSSEKSSECHTSGKV